MDNAKRLLLSLIDTVRIVGIKKKVYLNIVANAIPGMSLNVESRGGKTTFKWHKSMTHIRRNFRDRILNILHF